MQLGPCAQLTTLSSSPESGYETQGRSLHEMPKSAECVQKVCNEQPTNIEEAVQAVPKSGPGHTLDDEQLSEMQEHRINFNQKCNH